MRRGRQFAHAGPRRGGSAPRRVLIAAISGMLVLSIALAGCALRASREGIPAPAQATIDEVSTDIESGDYEKVYQEAADEWRRSYTLEASNAVFRKLKSRLGNVRTRLFHSATEEQSSGGQIPGHSFVISYQTSFERGEGMETFTLMERDGRWLLAGYFVNSSALK